MRLRTLIVFTGLTGGLECSTSAQVNPLDPAPAAPARQVEPGLEMAVLWKWKVLPSEGKDWGLTDPEEVRPAVVTTGPGGTTVPIPGATPGAASSEPRPTEYVVQKGDGLTIIGRKFGLSASQLKAYNKLTSDTIRIDQVLKIPTLQEVQDMAPPPPSPSPTPQKKKKKVEKPEPPKEPLETLLPPGQEDLLLQIFLDRENFSCGSIDGNAGPTFSKVLQAYRDSHPELIDFSALKKKAQESVGKIYTTYTLREEDLLFIEKRRTAPAAPTSRRRGAKSGSKTPEEPPVTYEELISARMLAYRSSWEFLAERFHCDEFFLRGLNPRQKTEPVAGTEIVVPNVIPFEIENAFEGTLQPEADPEKPVTVAIVEYSRIEVTRAGQLIAVAPIGMARPDLRGRGSWTILDAIPRPRLATLQEMKDDSPSAGLTAAPPKAILSSEQYLAAGPNNPVGIVWVNLAKAKSTEPLPYGLHGTSIPRRIRSQEGIGGIRLTNWDLIRIVHLIPKGTALQWK